MHRRHARLYRLEPELGDDEIVWGSNGRADVGANAAKALVRLWWSGHPAPLPGDVLHAAEGGGDSRHELRFLLLPGGKFAGLGNLDDWCYGVPELRVWDPSPTGDLRPLSDFWRDCLYSARGVRFYPSGAQLAELRSSARYEPERFGSPAVAASFTDRNGARYELVRGVAEGRPPLPSADLSAAFATNACAGGVPFFGGSWEDDDLAVPAGSEGRCLFLPFPYEPDAVDAGPDSGDEDDNRP